MDDIHSTNVAVIGSGGREHAIVWKLYRDNKDIKIYLFSDKKNLPTEIKNITKVIYFDFSEDNFDKLDQYCKNYNIDLIIVGPEVILSRGITDYFEKNNPSIKVFGPNETASKLETSKCFSKSFMNKYSVKTADYNLFNTVEEAIEYIEKLNYKISSENKLVIKYDGLAAGKGVFVCDRLQESVEALNSIKKSYGTKSKIVIEEKLTGDEISVIGFCAKNSSGKPTFKLISTARDYKKVGDNNIGNNTGGMGAISPHPDLTEELYSKIESNIINPTLLGIEKEKLDYCGFLYFGVMLDKDNNSNLLEYNVRLGDPEAQIMLSAMVEKLLEIIYKSIENNLDSDPVLLNNEYYLDLALISKGYPNKYEKNKKITGIDKLPDYIKTFFSGVSENNKEKYTSGGRVIHLVSNDNCIEKLREKIYKAAELIVFDKKSYRTDVGL